MVSIIPQQNLIRNNNIQQYYKTRLAGLARTWAMDMSCKEMRLAGRIRQKSTISGDNGNN